MFEEKRKRQEQLLNQPNKKEENGNGLFDRYVNPVLTAEHVPLEWRYDLDPLTNPYGLERIGVNATFNAGAMKRQGKYVLLVRV